MCTKVRTTWIIYYAAPCPSTLQQVRDNKERLNWKLQCAASTFRHTGAPTVTWCSSSYPAYLLPRVPRFSSTFFFQNVLHSFSPTTFPLERAESESPSTVRSWPPGINYNFLSLLYGTPYLSIKRKKSLFIVWQSLIILTTRPNTRPKRNKVS